MLPENDRMCGTASKNLGLFRSYQGSIATKIMRIVAAILVAFLPATALGKNCPNSQPCGNSCISWSYTCHIGTTPIVTTKAYQTISFVGAPSVAVGGKCSVSATTSSGLPVSYTTLTPTNCSISGSTVTGNLAGTCIIAANQTGNSSYYAASQVTQSIIVAAVGTPIDNGRVIAVTDGDTLTFLDDDNVSHKVRLAEIDAPEKCQAYGPESRDSLISLALNQSATLVVDSTDRYGREVGKVTVIGHTESTNKEQLRRGMAWVYDQYATDISLDGIEMTARQTGVGLWASANPMEPWVWRHGGYGCSRDPETVPTTSPVIDVTTSTSTTPSVVTPLVITEFFNKNIGHYFLTSSVVEAVGIENGAAGEGWERTGNSFQAWPINSSDTGTVPVCRFYAFGPNSHFYTSDPDECQSLKDIENTEKAGLESTGGTFQGWQYEGVVFKVKMPDTIGCPADSEPIYRSYNNRANYNDTNHRFSPWQQDIEALSSTGWIPEGVAMCGKK